MAGTISGTSSLATACASQGAGFSEIPGEKSSTKVNGASSPVRLGEYIQNLG
jgi:hypothetical protein